MGFLLPTLSLSESEEEERPMLEMSSSEACVGLVAFALETGFFYPNICYFEIIVLRVVLYNTHGNTSVADSDPVLFLLLDRAGPGSGSGFRNPKYVTRIPNPTHRVLRAY